MVKIPADVDVGDCSGFMDQLLSVRDVKCEVELVDEESGTRLCFCLAR